MKTSIQKRSTQQEGFTLVEMMITVVILGIMAAVAVPTYNKFITRAREGEASQNLAKIADGARIYFFKEHLDNNGIVLSPRFPGATTTWYRNPSTNPCPGGVSKYAKNLAAWQQYPWDELNFSLTTSHYFRYMYKYDAASGSRGPRYDIRAVGDMDCDNTRSTFRLRGELDNATGEIQRIPVTVTNEGE
ncbi:MAG TPA: hypothetical protein DCE42_04875 [Myxococcales bacterium]|nr:hypothetical protein [Deltaproteobacteria bacterium]HAA54063.1 hypothetical protein [Myxococcales bacterium]|tara:strand:+ start:3364 stop:3930 length:567 start_codon:yes stop_codon:yes gene_type:complete